MIESLSSVLKTIIFHGYTEPQEIQSLFPSKFNIYDFMGIYSSLQYIISLPVMGDSFLPPTSLPCIVTVDKKKLFS